VLRGGGGKGGGLLPIYRKEEPLTERKKVSCLRIKTIAREEQVGGCFVSLES